MRFNYTEIFDTEVTQEELFESIALPVINQYFLNKERFQDIMGLYLLMDNQVPEKLLQCLELKHGS